MSATGWRDERLRAQAVAPAQSAPRRRVPLRRVRARADDSPAADGDLRPRVPDHGCGPAHDRLRARAPQRQLAGQLPRRAADGSGWPRRPRRSSVIRSGSPPAPPETSVAEAVRAQLLNDALHRLVVEYLFALGVMTMISVGAGWLLAGRALRPLRDITATARRVSGQNLGERIALSGPADELKELADTFDGMLGRLDAAFGSQRHFVANASHELRTPLAIMRTEVDVALADPDADTRDLRRDGRRGARDGRPLRAPDRGPADARSQRGAATAWRPGRPGGAGGRLHHRPAGPRGSRRGRDPGRPRAGGHTLATSGCSSG